MYVSYITWTFGHFFFWPFLFLLYINDLPTIIQESQATMFADDTSLLKSGKKGELLLQPDVERLSNWFISNKLTINVGKCEIISFGIGAAACHPLGRIDDARQPPAIIAKFFYFDLKNRILRRKKLLSGY